MIHRRHKSWAPISVISFIHCRTYTLAWGFFFEKSQARPRSDILTWPCSSSRILAGYKPREKKSHIRSLLIEWHLSNRFCGGRNIKQFRVLHAFTWCTGHRWCKTKDLCVFCSSVKSVWLCFMIFVLLFYVICVRYHEVLKCRTSVTIPH